MKKNTEQRVLESWVGYLKQSPTWLFQIRRSWRVYTFRIVVIATIAWRLSESEFRATAFFAVGMLLGSLIRDFEWMRKSARLWPVVSKYLNWEKIKESHRILTEKKVEPGGSAYSSPAAGSESADR